LKKVKDKFQTGENRQEKPSTVRWKGTLYVFAKKAKRDFGGSKITTLCAKISLIKEESVPRRMRQWVYWSCAEGKRDIEV